MDPFYFGPSSAQLFGCYHAPHRAARNCAIVLCYPIGLEYIGLEYTRRHRAFRQLATRLARKGFPVLRFDFYGCGDSSGEWEEGRVARWLTDISSAVHEVRARSRMAKVCLVGFELGGTLAAMAGAERGDISGMVLWDPVVNGKSYTLRFQDLTEVKRPFFRRGIEYLLSGNMHTYTLGCTLTDRLIADLDRLDLLALRREPAKNILVINSNGGAGAQELSEFLVRKGVRLDSKHLPSRRPTLVPAEVLQAVVSWVVELEA